MPFTLATRARQETILIVDDQVHNLQVVGDLLHEIGCEIMIANSGMQALKRLEARKPDLILLDVMMPNMSGIATCKKIKEQAENADLPIVFLSAADDKKLIVEALESGGVDYVTKPFNRAELLTRVRTQLALKAARDDLRRLAEDKDELLGILTHDLKNHLGGMQMSAQLLKDRGERLADARTRRLTDNILHSTTQMLEFVKEYLTNAQSENQSGLSLQPVNVSDVARHSLKFHLLSAERKNIAITTDFSHKNVTAMADASALQQLLGNLLSNAIKFSPMNSPVHLSVHPCEAESCVECQIRDSGPGFSEEDHLKMFRRYGRLSARPTAGEPSTGLGLSIVKKLATAMQGHLTVNSTLGSGATFVLRLPSAGSPPSSNTSQLE